MSIEFVQSKDGSWTCFNAEIGEHYHNIFGAYVEAEQIYVRPSNLEEIVRAGRSVTVLDPFFGLGYNSLACIRAFLDLKYKFPSPSRLTLIAFEFDPQILQCAPEAIDRLGKDNLKNILDLFAHNIYYQTQHGSPKNERKNESRQISHKDVDFELKIGDTRQLIKDIPDNKIDLIYHDAFSPHRQPELWTTQLFNHYYRILKPDPGVVLTYSAAACIRSAAICAGLSIYPLDIPENKTGTLFSKIPIEDMARFENLEAALIESKSGIPYEDSPLLDCTRDWVVENRLQKQAESNRRSSSAVHRSFQS